MHASRHPTTAYRWVIFTLLAFGYVLVYFHRLCPAVLALDLMRDLKAGGSLIGLLGAAYFYPYALMQLPAGLLSDSWGPRNTITCFFIVAFIGSIILGLAPSALWAIVGRTIVGLGVAMLFVPTMKIVAEWFHQREFAVMAGLLLAVGGIGSLTAATPLVWLSTAFGWRHSFLLVGGFTLVLAILVRLFVYDRPADRGWPPPNHPGGKEAEAVGLMQGMRMVLTCPHFWPLAIWFFFDFAVFFSFAGLWGGPFLMHVYGMSKAEAGRILTMLAMGLVVGAPLLSWLSDKVFGRRKPVVLLCGIIMLILSAVLVLFTDRIPLGGLYALYFLFTVCGNAIGAVVFTMNKELFPVRIAGTATGLVNLFPFAGAAIFQPLIGFILESYGKTGDTFSLAGYKAAFITFFFSILIAVSAALFARETAPARIKI
jgi:sugar phosphate permease